MKLLFWQKRRGRSSNGKKEILVDVFKHFVKSVVVLVFVVNFNFVFIDCFVIVVNIFCMVVAVVIFSVFIETSFSCGTHSFSLFVHFVFVLYL